VGECFFWYRPTRVVLDKGSLTGCVCVCYVHLLQIVKAVEAVAQGQSPEIVEECQESACVIL